jgi:predicted enzyme related to lactoylglutathione lyase
MSDDGMIVWHELNTHDARKACDFYGSLLGWQFEEVPRPDIEVDDINERVAAAKQIGAQVIRKLFDLRIAVE